MKFSVKIHTFQIFCSQTGTYSLTHVASRYFPWCFQQQTPNLQPRQLKIMHLLLFSRFLPVCVVTGLRLLHVSHSPVDHHLLQAPSQPHPALLRMGASHHRHGHQQVCVCVCLVFKGEKTATLRLRLPVSGLLDDSSPKQIAAPGLLHPWVPLSLAASLIQPAEKD